MSVKLTKPQQETLEQVSRTNGHNRGFYAVEFYKPIQKLKELGLVELRGESNRLWWLTDKGQKWLEGKDER